MKQLSIFLICFMLSAATHAMHLMGGEVTYTHISNNNYKVLVTIYRDCNGSKIGGEGGGTSDRDEADLTHAYVRTVSSACQDRTIASIALTKKGYQNITSLCDKNNSACGSKPTYPFGIEAHYYEGFVNFDNFKNFTGCAFHIYVFGPSRSNALTNLTVVTEGGDNLYNYAYINPWFENISSPAFSNSPNFIYPVNQAIYTGDYATGTSGDSLVYVWSDPQKAHNTHVSYKANYAASQYITSYCASGTSCTANPSSNPPHGIYLNATTGDIVFTAIAQNEISTRVLEVEQWRRNGNSTYLAGKVRRDVLVMIVAEGQNNIPKIDANNEYHICEGEAFDLDIITTDATNVGRAQDSVQLSYQSTLPQSCFTKDSANILQVLNFSITPTAAQIGKHFIRIKATDNYCPNYGESYKTITIFIHPKPSAALHIQDLFCGNLQVNLTPTNHSYSLKVTDSLDQIKIDTNVYNGFIYASSIREALQFHLYFSDVNGCFDSLKQQYNNLGNTTVLPASLAGNTQYCQNNLALNWLEHSSLQITNTLWTWNNNTIVADTFNAILQTNGPLSYQYTLHKDGHECQVIEQASISVDKAPILTANLPTSLCFRNIIQRNELIVTPEGGNWSWNDHIFLEDLDISKIVPNKDTAVVLKYTYTHPISGCSAQITERIAILEAPILALNEQTVCGDKYSFQLRNCIQLPYNYHSENITWNILNNPDAYSNTPLPNINLPLSGIGTYVIEAINAKHNGCIIKDTTYITVTDNLTLTTNTKNSICQSDEELNITDYFGLNAKGGSWTSTDIHTFTSNSSMIPSLCGATRLQYIYDLYGCYDTIGMNINILCKPFFNLYMPDSMCANAAPISLSEDYQWSGEGVQNNEFIADIATLGSIELKARNRTEECIFDTVISIQILDPLHLEIKEIPLKLCENNLLELTYNASEYGRITANYCSEQELEYNNYKITYTPTLCDLQNQNITARYTLSSHLNCPDAFQDIRVPYFTNPKLSIGLVQDQCVPYLLQNTIWANGTENENVRYTVSSADYQYTGSGSKLNVGLSRDGIYSIDAMLLDNNGCIGNLTPQYFNLWPTPTADFAMLNKNRLALSERDLVLSNLSTINSGWFNSDWYYAKYGTSTLFSKNHNPEFELPLDTGIFKIILVTSTEKKCADTATADVILVPDIIAFIPSAFSPDNKGPEQNATFKIISDHAQDFHVDVYNRWGQLVYTSNNIHEGWDGSYLGKYCQSGVYLYAVKLVNKSGLEYQYQGTVTLLR